MYLIWGLLNIGLLIYFLTICFNAIKLVRREIGLFASIIFVIGLLSFCSHQSNNDKGMNSDKTKTWTFISKDTLSKNQTSILQHELSRNLISKYEMVVISGKDKNNINIPLSAFTLTNGFTIGTNWSIKSITVNKTNDNNKFYYYVAGVVEWQLLGISVYSQNKRYNGNILIDKASQ